MDDRPYRWEFPGDPGVENLPSNAGAVVSIPGHGTKILHASEQHPEETESPPATMKSLAATTPLAPTGGIHIFMAHLQGGKDWGGPAQMERWLEPPSCRG